MLGQRSAFIQRKSGGQKEVKVPLGLTAPPEELSSSFSFEFYLRSSQYHKGASAVLNWCKEHLKKKSLTEQQKQVIMDSSNMNIADIINVIRHGHRGFHFEVSFESTASSMHTARRRKRETDSIKFSPPAEKWFDQLDTDEQRRFRSLLNDPIFIRKDKVETHGGLLQVWTQQLFEDPFKYILRNVWMWIAATEYFGEMTEVMLGFKPGQRIAFRAIMDTLDIGGNRVKDTNELIERLVSERDGKFRSDARDSKEAIQKQIQRIKKIISPFAKGYGD